WCLRLFFDTYDTAPPNFGHSEAVGIKDFFQNDFRTALLGCEAFDGGTDVVLDDVIAEDHADRFSVGKVFRQAERFGDTAFTFLVGEVKILNPKAGAIAGESKNLAAFFPPVTKRISEIPAFTSVCSG